MNSKQKASRPFQIFVKPAGAACNLRCSYCYYLDKKMLYSKTDLNSMPDDILESYISQHIAISPDATISFSWHGGEPTILGPDYFHRIVEIQDKYIPHGRRIINGIQTNGTLLTEEFCRFFAEEGFFIGLSLDGPAEIHDKFRVTKSGKPTHEEVLRGYNLLRQYGITPDILCVVNAHTVRYPVQIYDFFRQIGAQYIGFLPMVEPDPGADGGVTGISVPSEAFGRFLCSVFDEWQERDIGKIKVQIFEEAVKTAFDQEHELCIFRETCGDVTVLEHNGDFYSCDHFVDAGHHLGNIRDTSLIDLMESRELIAFGYDKRGKLPAYCRACEFLDMCNGECPRNRFIRTPDGEKDLNYLCPGYKIFFNHCMPFVRQLASLRNAQTGLRQESRDGQRPGASRKIVGRNDPCPCGSGKKYKKCCLNKLSDGIR